MSESEFEALCDSVAFDGLLEPIVTIYDSTGKIQQILDGRSRYLACLRAKVEPRFVPYEGNTPFLFVVQKNLMRRNLTVGQRAVLADRLHPLISEERKAVTMTHKYRGIRITHDEKGRVKGAVRVDEQGEIIAPTGPRNRGANIAQKEASEVTGVGIQATAHAAYLRNNAPDLYLDVEVGKITLNSAYREAKRRSDPDLMAQRIIEKNKEERTSTLKRANTDVEINHIKTQLAEINRRIQILSNRDQELVKELTYEFFGEEGILTIIDELSSIIRKGSIQILDSVGS
jgi:hypothetical protein